MLFCQFSNQSFFNFHVWVNVGIRNLNTIKISVLHIRVKVGVLLLKFHLFNYIFSFELDSAYRSEVYDFFTLFAKLVSCQRLVLSDFYIEIKSWKSQRNSCEKLVSFGVFLSKNCFATSRIKTVRAGVRDCPQDNPLSKRAGSFDLIQVWALFLYSVGFSVFYCLENK